MIYTKIEYKSTVYDVLEQYEGNWDEAKKCWETIIVFSDGSQLFELPLQSVFVLESVKEVAPSFDYDTDLTFDNFDY